MPVPFLGLAGMIGPLLSGVKAGTASGGMAGGMAAGMTGLSGMSQAAGGAKGIGNMAMGGAKLAGKIGSQLLGGPLGMALMAAPMLWPMAQGMMGGGPGGVGGGAQGVTSREVNTGLERLSRELDRVVSGFHEMNVQLKQLSQSIGQATKDTLAMASHYASIGDRNAMGTAADAAKQLGRDTGRFRLGQGSQQQMFAAGALGLNMGSLMNQKPEEQMQTLVQHLRNMEKEKLNRPRTLALLEMFMPGQGQNLNAMGNISQENIDKYQRVQKMLGDYMSTPTADREFTKAENLTATASRIGMMREYYNRERQPWKNPFSEERAARREEKAEWGENVKTGWQQGLQPAKEMMERIARIWHEIVKTMFGEDTNQGMRTFGQLMGQVVSWISQLTIALGPLLQALNTTVKVIRYSKATVTGRWGEFGDIGKEHRAIGDRISDFMAAGASRLLAHDYGYANPANETLAVSPSPWSHPLSIYKSENRRAMNQRIAQHYANQAAPVSPQGASGGFDAAVAAGPQRVDVDVSLKGDAGMLFQQVNRMNSNQGLRQPTNNQAVTPSIAR